MINIICKQGVNIKLARLIIMISSLIYFISSIIGLLNIAILLPIEDENHLLTPLTALGFIFGGAAIGLGQAKDL